ncbi:MAG: hypothetical protein COA79_10640 [Planctomycetota bacterium]|nr:MAG: hypothetical protein COA79_10640 [Planctomycetota bacterium]
MKLLYIALFLFISFGPCKGDVIFGKWNLSTPKVKATSKKQMEYCLQLEKQNDYLKAISAHKQLLKYFKENTEAEESYIRIGELEMLLGKTKKAESYFFKLIKKQFNATAKIFGTLKKDRTKKRYLGRRIDNDKSGKLIYQILLKNLQDRRDKTSSPLVNMEFNRILKNLYLIGRSYQGLTSPQITKVKKYKDNNKFEKIYKYILERAPGFNGAAFMQNELAKLKLKKKKYIEAIIEFRKLTYDYSLSDEAQEASFYIGMCHLKLSRGPGYNEQNLKNASVHFNDHLLSHPSSKHAKLVQEKLNIIKNIKADSELLRIKLFMRRKQWKAAGIYLSDLFKHYPKSNATVKGKALVKKNKKIQMPASE